MLKGLFTGFRGLFAICAGLAFALPSVAQEGGASREIDLYLFGKNVVEDYNGCHIAFWQANKNPKKDKYAYVFYAPFNDGEELPGWVRIAKKTFELTRQDKGQYTGQGLEALRLYRTSKGTYTLLAEIIDQRIAGNDIIVDKAKLTIIRSKHDPFVITVKGQLACPQSAYEDAGAAEPDSPAQQGALYGDAISLGRAVGFNSLGTVPGGVLDAVRRDAPNCDPSATPGIGAKYAVSSAMTLWEIPCNLYARTGTSVFVTSLNDNPGYSSILGLPPLPDGSSGSDFLYEMRLPIVSPQSATFVSEFYDGDGTCGSYEKYQLRAVEGEALEFFLIEYRNKPDCDGRQGDPRDFPLVYRAGN